MSGHSKWSKIKRQKGATDAKRGAIFTKLGNLITIVSKEKGGDPETNFSLRMAMDKARAANMPKDNIEKAIKRGTGELKGGEIQELTYEGFGPAKSQFIIKSLTDNKNRSASSIRHIFTKYGGSFSSVAWNFEQKGAVQIANGELPARKASLAKAGGRMTNEEFENFELELIDNGAEDIIKEEEGITIYTNMQDLRKVKQFLDSKDIKAESAEIEYVAKEKAENPSTDGKEKIEKFIEELEDNEDVADYYTNVNI
jgi:YebC/PmpR family DNA-binding regulatory protein